MSNCNYLEKDDEYTREFFVGEYKMVKDGMEQ